MAAPDHRPAASQPRPIDDQFTPTDWSLFVAVATIWGSSFLFIDIGLDALPPGVITLMRVGLGALALAAIPRRRIPVEATDRPRVIALSIVWVAVPFTLFPIAEQHISSAVAGLLNGGTPIFAAIFAVVLFRQRTRGAQLLGIAIGFVGVVLVSLPSIGDGSSEALGVALVVAATVCYGLAVTIAAPLQQRYGSVNLMAKVLALATVWTAPYGLWQIERRELGDRTRPRRRRARRPRHRCRLRPDGQPRRPCRLDEGIVHHLPDPGGRARPRRDIPWRRRRRAGTRRHRRSSSRALCSPADGWRPRQTPTSAGRISPICPTSNQSA